MCYSGQIFKQNYKTSDYSQSPSPAYSISWLSSRSTLTNLGFVEFVSVSNLIDNANAVWVITETDLPTLWFDVTGSYN